MDTDLVTRRHDYLETLERTPRTKAELETVLGDSRSTVNRAVAELVEAGLVEDHMGQCQLTLAGRLAAEAVRTFREQTEGVMAGAELFDSLDPGLDVGLEMTTGATVWPALGSRPYRAFHAFERLIEEAEDIRGSVRTFANPRARELFDDALMNRGVPVEFYIDETLFDEIRDEFADAFDRWVGGGTFAGFVAPDCPRYTMLVSELPEGRHAGIALYSVEGEFHGVLINEREAAVEWAEAKLDETAAGAIPLDEVL